MTVPGPAVAVRRRTGRIRRAVPRLLLVLAVVIVVVMAFLAGGGWYFAGQIRSDGLAISPSSTDYDLSVVGFGHGIVTLREAPGHPRDEAVRKPYVYGLQWPGGSGILGAAASTASDGSVGRPLEVKVGVPPAPGMRAGLDREVYADPAAAYGVSFRDVSYGCAAGTCPAWYVPGTAKTWAIVVHGKGATRTEGLRALGPVLRARMPALLITYRNDVGAPRDPSGYYRYGATEWHDLDNAVEYAVSRGARQVVLFGFSMGGSIVASFLRNSAHAGVARGVMLDSPMLAFRSTVDYGASKRRLPVVGLPIPKPLTWTAETIAGHQYGIAWKAIDYLTGTWLRVPALVFHGTADDTIPIRTSDTFAKANPHLVHEIRVAGASHVESWNADPARYAVATAAFLDSVRSQG